MTAGNRRVLNDRVFDTETAIKAYRAAGFEVMQQMANVDYEWFTIKKDGVGLQVFCNTGPDNRTRPVFYGGSRLGPHNDGGMTLTDANLRVLREATKVYDTLYKQYQHVKKIGPDNLRRITDINDRAKQIGSLILAAERSITQLQSGAGLVDPRNAKTLIDDFYKSMSGIANLTDVIVEASGEILNGVQGDVIVDDGDRLLRGFISARPN